MSFATLPFEVVEHIVDLFDPPVKSIELCHLALSGSPFLLDVARTRLYKRLNFKHAWSRARFDKFSWTVSNSSLGQVTAELQLGLDPPIDDSDLFDKETMLFLFRTLPNLVSIRVGNSALRLAPSLKRAHLLQHVTALQVDYQVDSRPTRIRNFANFLPALQDLTIKMYASKKPPQEPDHLEPYDRSLHRLTLIQDRGARPAPFDLLLRLFKRYEELKIHGVHICNYKTLPPRYPPLQHFGLPGPEMLSSFELFVHSAIPLFLEQMVNLEAFYLVLVSKTGIMDTTVPDRLCSAGLIPRNIQLFSIRHQGYQSDFTPDFLAMKRCTPSLRRIQLDFRFGDHQQQKELAQRLKDVGVELDITMNVL